MHRRRRGRDHKAKTRKNYAAKVQYGRNHGTPSSTYFSVVTTKCICGHNHVTILARNISIFGMVWPSFLGVFKDHFHIFLVFEKMKGEHTLLGFLSLFENQSRFGVFG